MDPDVAGKFEFGVPFAAPCQDGGEHRDRLAKAARDMNLPPLRPIGALRRDELRPRIAAIHAPGRGQQSRHVVVVFSAWLVAFGRFKKVILAKWGID